MNLIKKQKILFTEYLDIKTLKIVFISVFIFGIVTHGMMMFNKFSIHDDLLSYDQSWVYVSGRFGLSILTRIEKKFFNDFQFSLPLLNSIISFIFISLSTYFIIFLFNIKETIYIIFFSALMIVQPCITSLFGYMYTSHYYMLSLFCGTLGTFLIIKINRPLKFFGVFLITCSISIYQAYIPFYITLCLFYLISNFDNLNIFKYIINICTSFIIALLFYFVSQKILMYIYKYQLIEYQGIDKMISGNIFEYLNRIKFAYINFFNPQKLIYPNNLIYIYSLTLILIFVLILFIIKEKVFINKIYFVIYIILILLIPISIKFINIMTSQNAYIHGLMLQSDVLIYILPILLWREFCCLYTFKFKKIFNYLIILIFSILIFNYIRFDNKCYLKINLVQNQSISYFTTLISKIKSVDGYLDEYNVSFINTKKFDDKTLINLKEYDDIILNPYYDTKHLISYEGYNKSFMKQWCGFNPTYIDGKNFENNKTVKDMKNYPDDGSIQIVDNTIIVKFGDYE